MTDYVAGKTLDPVTKGAIDRATRDRKTGKTYTRVELYLDNYGTLHYRRADGTYVSLGLSTRG